MKTIDKPKIVELHKSNFRDIPATLRRIADELEAGNFGVVLEAALVLQGSQIDLFHAGQGDATSAHILFACAQRKIEHAVIQKSGGYRLGND